MSRAYWLACALISEGRACFWTGVESLKISLVVLVPPPSGRWVLSVACSSSSHALFSLSYYAPSYPDVSLLLPHGLVSKPHLQADASPA